MNFAFALDFIPRRMRELGHDENYLTRYRQFRVAKKTTITIKASNQLWFFIEPEVGIIIKSERGIHSRIDTKLNELQHEHSGDISVNNDGDVDAFVVFIQVIPKNKKLKKP